MKTCWICGSAMNIEGTKCWMGHEFAVSSFEFTPEEQEHIRNTMQAIIEAVNAVVDAFEKIAKAVLEVIRKTFEGLMRLFAKLQLLEWRLPYRMAEYLSSKMPVWLAYKMGAAWFHSNVPALE